MIMFQVVVGDHDVTRGDGEQRASIAIVRVFLFLALRRSFQRFPMQLYAIDKHQL